ncbi:MAG: kynureninase [Phycisphaerales bacterium]|nr:kynureninase [Phycisphaerales bacterium]
MPSPSLSSIPGAPKFADPSEAFALRQDEQDVLRHARELFTIPRSPANGHQDAIYLTGNSLGAMPKSVRPAIEQELADWERLGVEAHMHGKNPWVPYHEACREPASRLVGALPSEVVLMNSLTVNLHLLMVSFYRPTTERFKIVIEDTAFPSDSYAVQSQAAFYGFDASAAIIRLKPREGETALRTDDILASIDREGPSLALVLLGAVNYLTGQWFDMPRITAHARSKGIIVGWDLAHAAGNVPLSLHDWNVDFAAWCSYKYLNSGPGAVAGAFVHERHGGGGARGGGAIDSPDYLHRFAGWWGNDPAARFKMGPDFAAAPGADGWQISNPPIFSLAPVRVSLGIFDRFGMPTLRAKSLALTGYLEWLLTRHDPDNPTASSRFTILTPRDPAQRGCQLSIAVQGCGREMLSKLHARGVICDFREPNVVRAAPVPLYTSFHDVWRFAQALRSCC